MKVAIIGGGFTGLACALGLLEKKVQVVLYEGENSLGGLAGGVTGENWKWSLEYFYHHIFTNDKEILGLAKKVGVKNIIFKPISTSFLGKKEMQLDSPLSVLKFSKMSFWGRIRMGIGLFILKLIPNGLYLEKYRVADKLPRIIGKEGYQIVWEKLLKAKFGPHAEKVNMAWFWARVAKRTKKLGYFEKGFKYLAEQTGEKIRELGGEIRLGKGVRRVEKKGEGKWFVDDCEYDGVVMTTPAPVTEKVLGAENHLFPEVPFLWGQTVILELREKFIHGYWMNILEKNWPFLVVVEHTNMVEKKYYGNNRVVYLGNYLTDDSAQLSMTKEKLITLYLPYLRKINKQFRKKWIKSISVFRKPFAQPVFPVNYSQILPKMKTAEKGLYLANMSMVYPYDRGTNYAVKMGFEVAKQMLNDLR